jgi:hypothetical protein
MFFEQIGERHFVQREPDSNIWEPVVNPGVKRVSAFLLRKFRSKTLIQNSLAQTRTLSKCTHSTS